MPLQPPVAPRSATERHQVYLEALALSKRPEVPAGTVCVKEHHYATGRHHVPYRTGYCHAYHTPEEHYHTTFEELQQCPLT